MTGKFLRSANNKYLLRIPKDFGDKRKTDRIPLEELPLAIYEVLRNSISISLEDLTKEVVRKNGENAHPKRLMPHSEEAHIPHP